MGQICKGTKRHVLQEHKGVRPYACMDVLTLVRLHYYMMSGEGVEFCMCPVFWSVERSFVIWSVSGLLWQSLTVT